MLLLGGGTLSTAAITQGTGGTGTVYFNGGTLQATGSGQLLAGLGGAYFQAGGGTINTAGYAVSIGQALGHDPGLGTSLDGGLTKLGAGMLILSGSEQLQRWHDGDRRHTGRTFRIVAFEQLARCH